MTRNPPRSYFSARHGRQTPPLSVNSLLKLTSHLYEQFEKDGYFCEHFGHYCPNVRSFIPGKCGYNVSAHVLRHLMRDGLWPLSEDWEDFTEDDLFDMIEFLHDHVSKPMLRGFFADGECWFHEGLFQGLADPPYDTSQGKTAFRTAINPLLEHYGPGYRLTEQGEIVEVGPQDLAPLLDAIPPSDEQEVTQRMASAVRHYRRRGATLDDRRAAVRDLADVLERLRPEIKRLLNRKDESDLFEIANQFGIRRMKPDQKTDYDPAIWLSWMFYHYLATIHACLRLIERHKREGDAL